MVGGKLAKARSLPTLRLSDADVARLLCIRLARRNSGEFRYVRI